MRLQAARFLVVGSTAFIVDAAVLYFAMTLGASPLLARFLSFPPALLTGFLLNRHWTFASGASGSLSSQFARYVAVQLGGIALNTAVFALVLWLAGRSDRLAALAALVAGSLAAMVLTFVGSRRLVFHRPR